MNKGIFLTNIQGCDSSPTEPWLTMQLTGKNERDGPTSCTTGILDHSDKIDFGPGNTAVFEGDGDIEALSNCYLVTFILF